MQTVMVGKAHIQVEVKGCFRCGTEHSSGWGKAREVLVTVGERRLSIEVGICADCAETEIPEGIDPPMKGRIGGGRVHLLDKVDRPEYGVWANAACGKAAGRFELIPEKVAVTCPGCRKLDPERVRTKVVKPAGGVSSGVF